MYKAKFEADSGKVFYFDQEHSVSFDMNVGDGVAVDIGTSQGFSQVGETVENHSIGGRPIEVKGVVFGDVEEKKREMRNVFFPFCRGMLTINSRYKISVYVKETPSFSAVGGDGRFTMLLFAPYPYFFDGEEQAKYIGKVMPSFSFPVNYAESHYFGVRGQERSVNIYNSGDVSSEVSFRIVCFGESTNPVVQNLSNMEFLKINGKLYSGDILSVYRGKNGVLKAELANDGSVQDVLAWIDEKSDFFELPVGDNLISATDDEGGANLYVQLMFSETVVSAYED